MQEPQSAHIIALKDSLGLGKINVSETTIMQTALGSYSYSCLPSIKSKLLSHRLLPQPSIT